MQAGYAIAGSIIAGYFGAVWALSVSALIGSTAILAAWFLIEPERIRARDSGMRAHHHMLDILMNTVLRSRTMLYVIFVFAGCVSLNQLGLWYYQPIIAAGGIDMTWMGFIFASFYVFVLLGSRLIARLLPRYGFRITIIVPVLLLLLGYVFMAQWLPTW
ncbi:MAG TPA: hypothetical protein PK765_01925 [bacterium]|nr:hypothetical protein [bacterium]